MTNKLTKNLTFEINQESSKLVKELILDGWQFLIVYDDIFDDRKKMLWEVNFTRRLPEGLWDNHESGYDEYDPNKAIKQAYQNIKNGKRLKRHEKAQV